MRQTFADILINHGIKFSQSPDTVIVSVDLPPGGQISIKDTCIKPIFDKMFIECYMQKSTTGFFINGGLIFGVGYSFDITAYSLGKGKPYQLPFIVTTEIDPNGHFIKSEFDYLAPPTLTLIKNVQTLTNLCYAVLSLFHKEHEIELVTHSRQIKRQIKRKTGKEPSPYFQINVNVDKKNKRYTASKPTGNTKNAHIVRGHFATYTDDNPLFGKYTGTYWRPSHARGIKSVENPTPKNYRIVLPDPTDWRK